MQNIVQIASTTFSRLLRTTFSSLYKDRRTTMSRIGTTRYYTSHATTGWTLVDTNRAQHSLVFVANDHAAWDPARAKKLRRKYGALVRSDHVNMNDMLAEHRDQVFNTILEQTKKWREHSVAQQQQQTAPDTLNGVLEGRKHRLPDDLLATPGLNVRGAPLGSPPASGTRTPTKLPPMGTFEVTSPLRSPAPRR